MVNIFDKEENAIEQMVEKFVVRFPQGMRSQIHQVANRARRSMNKEIVARLEHSLAHFLTVPGNGAVPTQNNQNTVASEIVDMSDDDKAYAEVILTNKLRQKIALLSYERKRALLKFL
jgi:hypothetical protein